MTFLVAMASRCDVGFRDRDFLCVDAAERRELVYSLWVVEDGEEGWAGYVVHQPRR